MTQGTQGTEELQFKVGEEEEEATVEMNEDGSDAKLSEKEDSVVVEEEKEEKASSQEPDGEELDDYSVKVKKRIDKMTARLREAQRREEAALEYAKKIQTENSTLQEQYRKTSTERLTEAQTRSESQIMALKQVIRQARIENDIDTETEAQQRLTSLVYEQQRLGEQVAVQRQQAERPVQQEEPEVLKSRRQPDVRAEEWAENNPWFGNNTVMTHTVYGIHNELVKNEGFDPTTDEYYDEIDRRMRQMFPQEYEPAQKNNRSSRPVQTVAPATRSSGVNNARRTVKLTPSQVAIAKKLGVSLEDYARHVKD